MKKIIGTLLLLFWAATAYGQSLSSIGGGGGTPGGTDTQVQFNDAGLFGGSSLFIFNKTTGNVSLNNLFANATITTAAGGTTVLTAASARYQALSGTGGQTFQLPDATTLPRIGPAFVFNNNASGSMVITNAGGTTIYTVPAGGAVQGGATNISTANGTWDFYPFIPSTVAWGSGTAGFVLNTALSSTPSVGAGTPSATSPVFIPRRDALTTGIGAQAAGNLSLIATGTEIARISSSGLALIGSGGAGQFVRQTSASGVLTASTAACSDLSNATSYCSAAIGQLPGTPTNDNASSGNIGEYQSASLAIGSATALTTATAKTITSVTLSAGDWDVSATIGFAGVGAPTVTNLAITTNTVTDALPTDLAASGTQQWVGSVVSNSPPYLSTRPVRYSLSGSTIIYMIGYAEFTGGTSLSAFGQINARRAR